MLKKINIYFNDLFEVYYKLNPWNNVYGLTRSILALSLLVTLIFTGKDILFSSISGERFKALNFVFQELSIFNLFNENITLAYYFSIIILTCVISGYFPQITGVLHWWISYSFLVSTSVIEGGDQVVSILTLFIIPITITDNRLNHWGKQKTSNKSFLKLFIWSFYFIISLQISIIYFHSMIAKLQVEQWINGTATYYWFTHNIFGVPDNFKNIVAYLMSYSFFVTLSTWGAILIELFLFAWIFMKRNSINWKILFSIGLIFHLSIALVFGLSSFAITMTAALVIYLIPKNNNIKWII